MPRITLGDRLQAIVDSPNLPASKLNFAKSLLAFYQRKRMLTKGRRHWVDNLEAMIEARANLEDAEKPEIVEEIDALIARMPEEDASSWNMGFAQSLREQAMTGHARGYDSPLSEAQRAKLADISAEYTDDALAARNVWPTEYREKYIDEAGVLANYYASTAYYREYVYAMRKDPDHVPPRRFFMKLYNNKYAQKVLKAHKADAKYPVGSAVKPRAGAAYHIRNTIAKGAVVIANDLPIISAANGAKHYKVLPYGGIKPVNVEERHIKRMK
jgi:hypothetical protein